MNPNASPPDLREIVKRLGGDLYNGGRAALVPSPGHTRKDRGLSLRLTPDGNRVLWFSHNHADAREVWKHLGLEGVQAREETAAERRKREAEERAERDRRRTFCAKLWQGTAEALGSPVERYLKGRAITGPIPPAIRFHAAAPSRYPTADQPNPPTFPAMVAIATAEDGKTAAGLHVTFLQPDGSAKANLRQARRMFGELGGAVVQLGPFPEGGELAVAEGIETALAYRDLTGATTWAALSTAGLRRFMPPRGLSRLVIAADSDDGPNFDGMAAARVCAERASRRCEAVICPAPEGLDWNDALQGGRQ